MGCGLLFAAPGSSGSSSSGAGALGSQSGRSLGTTGGTSTSTQHSAHGTACASYLQSGAGALGGSTGAYDEMAQRIGSVGFVGAYSPEQRRLRIEKFIEKRGRRVWTKKVKYDVRKNFADSRLRVKVRPAHGLLLPCLQLIILLTVFYIMVVALLRTGALCEEGGRGHHAGDPEHMSSSCPCPQHLLRFPH